MLLRRLASYLIDLSISLILLTPFWFWYLTGLFSQESGVYLLGYGMLIPLLWILVRFLLSCILPLLIKGSAGYRIMGLSLLDRHGRPARFGGHLAHWVLLPVEYLSLGIGTLLCLFRADGRMLHDCLSGTTVVFMSTR